MKNAIKSSKQSSRTSALNQNQFEEEKQYINFNLENLDETHVSRKNSKMHSGPNTAKNSDDNITVFKEKNKSQYYYIKNT